jgi:hypothetical protein
MGGGDPARAVNAGVLLTHLRQLRIDPPPGGPRQWRRRRRWRARSS